MRAVRAAAAVCARAVTLVIMDDGSPRSRQVARAALNMERAADLAASAGATLSIEPVAAARLPGVLIQTVEEAVALAERVGHEALGVTVDTCHVTLSGGDPSAAIRAADTMMRAVQIADMPGRVEPGAGTVAWEPVLRALDEVGWRGALELEFFASSGEGVEGERAVLRALDRLFG